MKLGFTVEQERFRAAAAEWLEYQLSGAFVDLRDVSAHADMPDRRKEWEQALGRSNWSCVGWPKHFGGRDATLAEQVIFAEEYARAGGPNRIGHLGVELVGPTLLALGTAEQQQRFLPPIARGEEIWCQGYSEPNAGSDLANVRTSARIEQGSNGAQWVVNGQKIWTSLAQFSDWIFVLARTEVGSRGHDGLSYLLVPMNQPGVTVRPIREMTGDATFNETFFQDARTPVQNVVGAPGDGWKVAMATLGFERGVSTLAHQMAFRRELDSLIAVAIENGVASDPDIRQRLAEAYIGLKVMRHSALRMLTHAQSGRLEDAAYTYRVYWGEWHQKLGELAMDVLGPAGEIGAGGAYEWEGLQKMFLFSRADTIYGGTSQIQRNIIAERALGLPKRAARAAAGTARTAMMETLSSAPPYPPGRDLLRGKTVLVTAAAGTGIGYATAKRCIEEGARVFVSDLHERRLGEAVQKLSSLAGATPFSQVCDVTKESDVRSLIDAVVKKLGRIDVLVNNAGLGGSAAIVEMTDEQWYKVLDVSLTSVFRMTRAVLPHMYARRSGVIVNNASVLGWRAQALQAHYAAAKAGVMAFTRCAAIEAAQYGVRVNAVAPSIAMHEFLNRVTSDDLLTELRRREAFGRTAEVWEIANVIVFLAGDLSTYLTGEVISVSSQRA